MSEKRKSSDYCGSGLLNKKGKELTQLCILHDPDAQLSTFTSFSKAKGGSTNVATGKLAEIHRIRDQRLSEAAESPYLMSYVCNHIPVNLDDLDLSMTGYHRICYQKFTKNLDRLQCNKASSSTTCSEVTRQNLSRKSHHLDRIFPIECILCEKVRKKGDDKLKEFSSFKGKEAPWKQIGIQASELGNMQLHRRVLGEDLFAKAAKHHNTCFNKFRLAHINHIHQITACLSIFEYTVVVAV